MRVLNLFTGSGGGVLAEHLLGWESVGYLEWDSYCCDRIADRVADGSIPDAPIFQVDVRDFVRSGYAELYRGVADVVAGGPPCFVAGTHVLTDRGYVPIESLVVGDLVLTHRGRWRHVTSTMRREDAPLVRVDAQGVPGVVTTPEHPFYARKTGKIGHFGKRHWKIPKWTDAKDLRGHFVGQVLPEVGEWSQPTEFWWVVGRYLADGWRVQRKSRRDHGRVTICCAHEEVEELERSIRAAGWNPGRVRTRTTFNVSIYNVAFYRFLAQFGSGAGGKLLPGWCLGLDQPRAEALLAGYLSGDGSRNHNGWRANSVSKALSLGFALLAQRARGVVASIRKQATAPTTVIEGRTVKQRPYWVLDVPDRNRSGFIEERHAWKCVRKVRDAGRGVVYNISVDGDESYVADGAIVHNCQPFSSAGRKKGAGDERNMWPAFRDVVEVVRPRYVVVENVPGLMRGKSAPYFGVVLADLGALGYRVVHDVVSAADAGAPHRRERLWVVGELADTRRRSVQPDR